MSHILALLLALAITAAALVYGIAAMNDSQANRVRAEAQAQTMIIRAESDARFRDAQSTAITMAAAVPMVLIITGGVVGTIGVVALVIFAVKYRPNRPQVIERQVIYVLPTGAKRSDLWQALSTHQPEMILPGKYEVKQ